MKMSKPYYNVFEAIEHDPAVAENLRLRSALMSRLEKHIRQQRWTQAVAAKRLGVTQPRISNLFRGKIEMFALDKLVDMASRGGLRIELKVVRRQAA